MTASIVLLLLVTGSPAELTRFLTAARARNQALGISRAQLSEQEASTRQALAALTPTLQLNGSYTRNQYEAVVSLPDNLLGSGPPTSFTNLTIQPYNAWAGTVGLNIPLFSAGSLYRYGEADHSRLAAQQGLQATEAEVLISTARAYYQVVGGQGVVDAAVRALATAQDSLKVTALKLSAGTANRLAVDRAKVDVARAQQTLATSRQALAVAQRSLETLSGESVTQPLPAPDPPELPGRGETDYVDAAEQGRPELAQADELLRQQELSVREAWAQLTPTLVGSVQEHFTNVTGFTGQVASYTLGANLAWTLDPIGTPAAIHRAQAVIEEQRHRIQQQRDSIRDEVHSAWLDVDAGRARLEEATSEVESAREALAITQEQYRAGTATSLDLSQAQRDAFSAEATLAQSQANLAAALLSLKKAAGEPLLLAAEGGN